MSKQVTLLNPINSSNEIYDIAFKQLEHIWDKNGVRLVGIRVSNLVSNYYFQGSIFDND